MAITRVQQTQISGSLSQDDNLEAGSGLGAKANLKGDLDALRSQIKRIVGGANWYTALSGSQDLADIYAAVHMSGVNADFQGTLDVTGAAVLDGTLSVVGNSVLASADIGGGFGSTGVTISGAGGIQANGALEVGGASMLSGSLTVLGGSTLAAVNASGILTVTGNSILASADIGGGFGSTGVTISGAGGIQANGALEVGGASMLSGSLNVLGASQFAAVNASGAVALASTLSAGVSTLASLGVTMGATVGTTLTVTGATTLNGGLTMDTAAFVVQDTTGNTLIAGTLSVGQTLGVTGAATLASVGVTGGATVGATLGVVGASSFASTVAVTGASTFANISNQFNALSVTGSAGLSVIGPASFSSTVGVTGALTAASPSNVMNGLSVTGSNGLSVSSNLSVLGNATVQGDLYVKGTTTYIQTDNMIVKDAFIYLATGSAGTTDSGLVFMKGAGASFDLILGQDNGDGEFIFAKQAHNASLNSPSDLNASALVPAWMGVAKIGSYEGTLRGALSSSAGEFSVKAEAGVSLKLTALGDEAFDLAVDGEQATFDALFTATSIIGAIMEAKNAASSAGFFQKGTLSSANVAANVLTFSSIGTLSSAVQKNIDVFLNGVLLAPIFDVASVTTTTATLDSAIGGALTVDDVITVCLRSTTA